MCSSFSPGPQHQYRRGFSLLEQQQPVSPACSTLRLRLLVSRDCYDKSPKLGGLKPHVWDVPGGPVIRINASTAGGMGLIPGQGTKIFRKMQDNSQKNPHTFVISLFWRSGIPHGFHWAKIQEWVGLVSLEALGSTGPAFSGF